MAGVTPLTPPTTRGQQPGAIQEPITQDSAEDIQEHIIQDSAEVTDTSLPSRDTTGSIPTTLPCLHLHANPSKIDLI